ncbi:nucleotide exchange factor GrpE [Candidatus Micrarchaeota archaeon]|nr:nucleotide exchange factor GrpE [Candidatus Micrarchaeota archaeon]
MKQPLSHNPNPGQEPSSPQKRPENHSKTHEKSSKSQKNGVKLEETVAELTELLQRNRAEFENYQKRTEKEKQVLLALSKAETIQGLLPVWDSLEEALRHAEASEKKALEPIAQQFKESLQKMGLKPMESKGKKFDAHQHDCLITEHNPSKPEEIVLEELQKGFWLNDQVLRHAKVKINKIEKEKEGE